MHRAALVLIAANTTETLPPGPQRNKINIKKANPVANLLLLGRHGAGLRNLSIATACYLAAQSTWSAPVATPKLPRFPVSLLAGRIAE